MQIQADPNSGSETLPIPTESTKVTSLLTVRIKNTGKHRYWVYGREPISKLKQNVKKNKTNPAVAFEQKKFLLQYRYNVKEKRYCKTFKKRYRIPVSVR
jgi:hypothetical protein